jgi:hypothetical protein
LNVSILNVSKLGLSEPEGISQVSLNLDDHLSYSYRQKTEKKLTKNSVALSDSSGNTIGKIFMEIWIIPECEVLGSNVVGEERNDPNQTPFLPTPEEGRSWLDLDALANFISGLSFDLFGGLFTKLIIAGSTCFI